MDSKNVIERIESINSIGEKAINGGGFGIAQSGYWAGFRSAALSLIKNLFGEKHPYYKDFDKYTATPNINQVDAGMNILLSIKTEIELGWIKSYKGLI